MQIGEGTLPLHTLIELEPCAGGAMIERRHEINVDSRTDADVRFRPPVVLFLSCQAVRQLCSPPLNGLRLHMHLVNGAVLSCFAYHMYHHLLGSAAEHCDKRARVMQLFASSTEGARGLSPPGPRNAGTPCYHPARIAHQTSIQAANRHSTFSRCRNQGSLPQPLNDRMPAQPASPLSPLAANLRGPQLLNGQGGAVAASETSPLAVPAMKELSVPTIPEHPESADAAGAWPSNKGAPQMPLRGSEDTDGSTASDWDGRDLLVREASSKSADQPNEAEAQAPMA